jgi:hypothetical protein
LVFSWIVIPGLSYIARPARYGGVGHHSGWALSNIGLGGLFAQ